MRLTHTLGIGQIGRTLALNEDLTEAICLGHNLGHLAFGHSAEPARLPETVQARRAASDEPPERLICDHIAGMTDRFALDEYARLLAPSV
jgi:dGTP triphosphohydrolase